jgi:hypothetical protein
MVVCAGERYEVLDVDSSKNVQSQMRAEKWKRLDASVHRVATAVSSILLLLTVGAACSGGLARASYVNVGAAAITYYPAAIVGTAICCSLLWFCYVIIRGVSVLVIRSLKKLRLQCSVQEPSRMVLGDSDIYVKVDGDCWSVGQGPAADLSSATGNEASRESELCRV